MNIPGNPLVAVVLQLDLNVNITCGALTDGRRGLGKGNIDTDGARTYNIRTNLPGDPLVAIVFQLDLDVDITCGAFTYGRRSLGKGNVDTDRPRPLFYTDLIGVGQLKQR